MKHVEYWKSTLSREVFEQVLKDQIETIEEFRLISKLSGAGIVVRALECPETTKPLMGFVNNGVWNIAHCLEPIDISPYQPILQCVPDTTEDTTKELQITISYNPHKDVYLLGPVEWLGGVLSIVAGVVGSIENPLAFGAIVLGVGIILLPRFRANWNFTREVERARKQLHDLPLEWSIVPAE